MTEPTYTPTSWSDGVAPPISGANLDKIEQGIKAATDRAVASVPLAADSQITAHVSIARPYAVGDYPLKVGTGAARGAPTITPTCATGGTGVLTGVYKYAYTETDLTGGETTLSPVGTYTASSEQIKVTIGYGRPGTVARNLYRTTAGGGTFELLHSFGGGFDSHQTIYTDNSPDSSLGATAPATDGTQSWSFLVQPDGLTYVSGSPGTPEPDDFAVLIADGNNGSSWAQDNYGPVITRTSLGVNFIAYHTQSAAGYGASFQAYITPSGGDPTPVLVAAFDGQGRLTIHNQLATVPCLQLDGGSGPLTYRAAQSDTNPTFTVDSTGKLQFGVGGGTTVDVNLYRKAATIIGTDYSLSAGLAASPVAGLHEFWPPSSQTDSSVALRTAAGSNFRITASNTAATGVTIQTMNGAPVEIKANGHSGMKIDTAGGLGFYGHATIAQQLLATGASHTVDDVITALQGLGLVRQS